MKTAEGPSVLKQLTGKHIASLRRVHYVKPDGTHAETGPLEMTLNDGPTILMTVGPDGDTLLVSEGPWLDPFAGPLSPENRSYIRQVGKWTCFDVTTMEPYASLVGQRISSVETGFDRTGKLRAATVRTGSAAVVIYVEADELVVMFARSEP